MMRWIVGFLPMTRRRQSYAPPKPGRTTLLGARLQLDAIACLIERRQIAELSKGPNSIVSAHCFSDGSPVTGWELQGMVLQLFVLGGTFMNIVMPGVSLGYRMCTLMDNIFAFPLELVFDRWIGGMAPPVDDIENKVADYRQWHRRGHDPLTGCSPGVHSHDQRGNRK